MSAEQNKANDHRFFEVCLNKHHVAGADEFCAPTITVHSPLGTTQGIADYKQFLTGYFTGFPDLHFTLNDQIAEGNTSLTHWTASGTHKGTLADIPPTGKQATNPGVTLNRWSNGKILESWIFFDNLALMQQLGVIPKQR